MTRLVSKVRRRFKPFESARSDLGNFYHRRWRRARIVKKFKNWIRKRLKNRYFPRPWYGKNTMERVKNLESKSPIRRRRLSVTAKQARKYLRMRYYFYNVKPRSFYRTAHKGYVAGNKARGPHNALAYMLEGRVDSVLYRANFARTKRFMRQFIRCSNSICVNAKKVNKPFHQVEAEQIVSLLINPRDSQYRAIPKYGVFIKRNKVSKRRKKFVNYLKRYRKKSRKTYKKKYFLFLFKGVFDKNWIYRKKNILHKLRFITFHINRKKNKKLCKSKSRSFNGAINYKTPPKAHKFNVSTVFKFKSFVKVVHEQTNSNYINKLKFDKKISAFRLKFYQMLLSLRNLMRVKRLIRYSHPYFYRKLAKIKGIAFTRYVLKKRSSRKLFPKKRHKKKRRYFVVIFHQFKRMRIKRAEASRYLLKLREVNLKRRYKILNIKQPLLRRKQKKLKIIKQQRLYKKVLKKIKPKFRLLKLYKLNTNFLFFQTKNKKITGADKKFAPNYDKILFKKICIMRNSRLLFLQNLSIYRYYFLILKNIIAGFTSCENFNKSSAYKQTILFKFFIRLKKKNKKIKKRFGSDKKIQRYFYKLNFRNKRISL